MDEWMTLNDGTQMAGHAVEFNGQLFLYVRGEMGLADVFQALIDPERTKKITAERFGVKTIYRGYKKLTAVRDEGGGLITAVLNKA